MKIIKDIRRVGDGAALVGAQVAVQTWPELVSVGSGEADADGLATITAQGSPGQIRTRSSRGGFVYDEFSGNVQPVGAFDLENLQTRVGSLVADGILGDYGNRFRISTSSGLVTAASGGVVLFGILALFPNPTTIAVTDGDRVLAAYMDDNEAISIREMAYADYDPDNDVGIYRYTATSGNVVTSSITDIGRMAGPRAGRKAQIGIARLISGSTTSVAGEASGLSTTLTLEAGTYDIRARVSALGNGRDGALALNLGAGVGTYRSLNGDVAGRVTNADVRTGVTGPGDVTVQVYERSDTALVGSGWTIQATYGPTFGGLALSSPSQVAINSFGYVYVADTGNGRLVLLAPDGSYFGAYAALTGITGICFDASNNYYILYDGGADMRLRKYDASGAVDWTVDFGPNDNTGHVTTNGTHVWACNTSNGVVYRRLCSTGGGVDSFGGTGSSDGRFGTGGPFGICNDGTHLYVSDPGNSRIQKFSMLPAYAGQWSTTYAPAAMGIDASGDVIATYPDDYLVRRYSNAGSFIDQFSQTGPTGVGVASGDVLWISNAVDNTIAKWDESSDPLPFEYQAALLAAIAIPR